MKLVLSKSPGNTPWSCDVHAGTLRRLWPQPKGIASVRNSASSKLRLQSISFAWSYAKKGPIIV